MMPLFSIIENYLGFLTAKCNPLKRKMNRVLSCLTNLSVEVHTVTGNIYQGVLHKFGEKNIILKAVILYDGTEFKTIDHVHIELSKITLLISAKFPIVPKRRNKGFTDGEISSNKNTQRELVKFDMPANYVEEDLKHSNEQWDQFEVNEKKFGVTTTYDESLYTTKLDKTSKDYKSKERDAARIAKEIECGSTSNVHLKEERGQVAEKEVDEETKYSQVLRPNLPKPKGMSFASIAAQNHPNEQQKSANVEKAQNRINLFKQTEKRKVQHKKNEDKLNLIEFSKSFKLKTPMPEDIKELLKKPEEVEPAELPDNNKEESWNWNVEAPEFQPDEYIDQEYQMEPAPEADFDSKFLDPTISDKNVKISYSDLFPEPKYETDPHWETDPNQDYESLYYMPQYYNEYEYYDYNNYYYNYENPEYYQQQQETTQKSKGGK